MEKLVQLKNPLNGKYFNRSADIVQEADKDQSIIYKESTAKKILHDTNVIQELFMKHENPNAKFPGYQLVPVTIDDIQLEDEQLRLIDQYAKAKNITQQQATKIFKEQLVDFWDACVLADPFGIDPLPVSSPMETFKEVSQ